MLPFISIIVPVFRDEKTILENIQSLKKLEYPSYEIIYVIDRDSDDDSLKIIKKNLSRKIRYFINTRRGAAANRNFGIKKASKKAKYLAFTDADCIVQKDWLKILVKEMESQKKEVGCVGGINLVPKNAAAFEHVTGALESTILGGGGSSQGTRFRNKVFVPSIPNCNSLYRKELWQKNRQNESLIVGQDGEFNYRLWKKGNKFLVNPKAVVYHHRPSSLKKFTKRMYSYGVATAKIFKMHPEILKIRWYGLASVFALAVAVVLIILSFFNFIIFRIFLLLLLIYLILLIITTIEVYYKSRSGYALLTPLLLLLQHLLYPIGFLKAIMF